MRNVTFLIFALAVIGCARTNKDTDSETKFLSLGSYNCTDPDDTRLTEVKAMIPNGMVSNDFGAEKEAVYKRLAGIPNAYLKHLIDRFNSGQFSGIAPATLGSGIAGLTMLQGTDFENMYAKSISIRPGDVNFAFQHEVGHAVETFVKTEAQKNGANFSSGFQTIYNEAQGSSQIRSYAKSSSSESWAESFSNFYCSAEAKSFIGSQMPTSYGFLNSVLLPTIWDKNSNPLSPSQPSSAIAFAFTPSLSPAGDTGTLILAGAQEIFSFEICENTAVADCAIGIGNYKKIVVEESKGNRKYFTALEATTISNEMNLTLIGRDKGNKLIASKVIKLAR